MFVPAVRRRAIARCDRSLRKGARARRTSQGSRSGIQALGRHEGTPSFTYSHLSAPPDMHVQEQIKILAYKLVLSPRVTSYIEDQYLTEHIMVRVYCLP
jgi:hypothetical protein